MKALSLPDKFSCHLVCCRWHVLFAKEEPDLLKFSTSIKVWYAGNYIYFSVYLHRSLTLFVVYAAWLPKCVQMELYRVDCASSRLYCLESQLLASLALYFVLSKDSFMNTKRAPSEVISVAYFYSTIVNRDVNRLSIFLNLIEKNRLSIMNWCSRWSKIGVTIWRSITPT